MRATASIALLIAVLAAATSAAAATRVSKPVIKGEEVGYFGSATVAHRISVFVYSPFGPGQGNHVTVCIRGTCERARGHDARLAWFSASFRTRGLRMGQAVRFTVTATAPAGHARLTVTKPLLCMHNNGSTPQS